MQVFSLLGFVDYEGSELVGVFGSLDDLLSHVRESRFWFDALGYVESALGQVRVDDRGDVVYVQFTDQDGVVHPS
jgi:hypothetical protein